MTLKTFRMWSKPCKKNTLCVCMFLFSKIWWKHGETSPQLLLWCDNFAEHLRCCFLFVLELLEGCMNMLGTPPTFDASSFFPFEIPILGVLPPLNTYPFVPWSKVGFLIDWSSRWLLRDTIDTLPTWKLWGRNDTLPTCTIRWMHVEFRRRFVSYTRHLCKG